MRPGSQLKQRPASNLSVIQPSTRPGTVSNLGLNLEHSQPELSESELAKQAYFEASPKAQEQNSESEEEISE